MSAPSEWPGLEVRLPADAPDDAEDMVAAALPDGVLLGMARTTWTEAAMPAETRAEPLRLQVYLAPGSDIVACARVVEEALDVFGAVVGGGRRVVPSSTPHEDWAVRWKVFFHPIRVSDRIAVVPAWEDAGVALADIGIVHPHPVVIRIEPGQAFGSGTHPTTRLVLRELEDALRARGKGRVLDFGAGSGILGFAAVGLGARSVVGIEIDPDALSNFRLNATLNPGAEAIDYRLGSSGALTAGEVFDLIVCNALFDRVNACFADLFAHLAPDGAFLYSGFLETERDEVERHVAMLGLDVARRAHEDEWGSAVFCRS